MAKKRKAIPRPAEPSPAKRDAALTDRERDVLKLFAAGHTYDEIGEQLGISVKTIGTYLNQIRLGLT